MFRRFLAGLALTLTMAAVHAEAFLKVAAPPGVAIRAASADVVVTGKVTAIEKDEVELPSYPGSSQKVSYKVAVVKIADALHGAKNETHIKVAFQPAAGGGRRGAMSMFDFQEGAEGLFFLAKQADAGVYTFNWNSQPIEAKAENYKADLELAKKAVAVFEDPMKSLKTKENADRYFAAAMLVAKYRTAPAGGAKTELVPADESKLILQTILESDWSKADTGVPAPYQTFTRLGMTAADKWKPAAFNGNGDFNAHMKAEFQTWLDGDGAKYQIKKFVAK
ncbi:hypothetical protein [Limnoglobus roseus]|uniref:Uncharacterized protein n=1 Tax=Limnoglobus roseus TaxID=2598579 RepID=A0A5C1ASR6_9BACT|nr:hypothetical protein [Limnoglobus roseus]QEL20294.1 hypothetical protein PX52LOC_07386 [Limnoglobus roseus]